MADTKKTAPKKASKSKAASPKKTWPDFDRAQAYALAEAVKLLKSMPNATFDETVDVALALGVDPKKGEENVRGSVVMPHGTGKSVRVAVVAKGNAADDAKKAGADVVGDEDLIAKIEKGDFNFDTLIATPDCMPMLSKVARVLGPKGLMPNPKLGTVTPNPEKAVKDAKAGQVAFRVEKAGHIHAGVGKKSFDEARLVENIQALVKAVKDARPATSKGEYLKRMSISSTMGKSIKVDVKGLTA